MRLWEISGLMRLCRSDGSLMILLKSPEAVVTQSLIKLNETLQPPLKETFGQSLIKEPVVPSLMRLLCENKARGHFLFGFHRGKMCFSLSTLMRLLNHWPKETFRNFLNETFLMRLCGYHLMKVCGHYLLRLS